MDNWDKIKKNVYFEDGSFRDIYVFNTSEDDWLKWVEFINLHYEVEFGSQKKYENKIDYEVVKNYLNDEKGIEESIVAYIKLSNTLEINCLFWSITEIENYLSPKQVKNMDDHNSIIRYLQEIAKLLSKKVVLTLDDEPESILLEI